MKLADKRRGKWLALGLIGLLLIGWAWLRIPRYEGRSFTYWFNEFHRTGQGQRQPRGRHVQRAIQAFGTNAVPALLDLAFKEDYRSWDIRLWHRTTKGLPGLAALMPAEFQAYMRERESAQFDPAADAITWLWHLRPPPSLLLSTLTNQLASDRIQPRFRAILMLGCLDATALPYLRPAFTNHTNSLHEAAFAALAGLGTNAVGAVPEVITALADPLLYSRGPIQILHRIGSPARSALPQLRELWQSETNFHALAAIIQIADDPEAKEAFRQSLRQHTDPALRLRALRFLEEHHFINRPDPSPPIADARFLLPELLQAAEDDEAEVRFHALAAIGRLNLDVTPLKPRLEAKLREPVPAKDNTSAAWNEWHERLWASDLLLRREPDNAVALAFLADRLGDFQAWQAVDILARMEWPSPALLALLERATWHRDQSVRDLATEALTEFR